MDGVSKLFSAMRASSSGLSAERQRIETIARNIANANSTRTPNGGPYRRRVVALEPLVERDGAGTATVNGVRVSAIRDDTSTPFELIHDPAHPDADAEGNVALPNVNTAIEMTNLITAMRAYDANLRVQQSFVRMAERAIDLAR